MTQPRDPRPKRRCGGSRSYRRRRHESTWLIKKLSERFERFAELIEQKRQQDIADGTYRPPLDPSAKEKAPSLATGGSILSEDQNA